MLNTCYDYNLNSCELYKLMVVSAEFLKRGDSVKYNQTSLHSPVAPNKITKLLDIEPDINGITLSIRYSDFVSFAYYHNRRSEIIDRLWLNFSHLAKDYEDYSKCDNCIDFIRIGFRYCSHLNFYPLNNEVAKLIKLNRQYYLDAILDKGKKDITLPNKNTKIDFTKIKSI